MPERTVERMNGLTVVSGVNRSGTSLWMNIFREILGEDRILGDQFPREVVRPVRREKETDDQYAIRKYVHDRLESEFNLRLRDTDDDDTKDMNPEGFWEMEYAVHGLRYMWKYRETLADIRKGRPYVCKIVSQGLKQSDPSYISRVVYTIRDPKSVAKSQERLRRPDYFEGYTVNTPEMGLLLTLRACEWIVANPDIPVFFAHYEDLVSDPITVLERVSSFIGADFTPASKLIRQDLNRSSNAPMVENPMWEDAEYVYKEFCKGVSLYDTDKQGALFVFQDLLDWSMDPKLRINRENYIFYCPRAKLPVSVNVCKQCQIDPKNRRIQSEKTPGGGHWSKWPCPGECGADPLKEPKTIEESILNNHFADVEL